MSSLPHPRGPVSEALFAALRSAPHRLAGVSGQADAEDLHLALYCCYELHYRGFAGVDDRWEWEPSLLALRGALEQRFEADLRRAVPTTNPQAAIDVELRAIEAADDGPSL